LDSGDIFQGTPEGNLTKGRIVIVAMNLLGYDAMAIGNHEYDYGEANLRSLQRQARFPFLGSNILRAADRQPVNYAVPHVLLHVGGVRLGIMGIATHTTRTSTLPANVKHLLFTDEVAAAALQAKSLRAAGAHIVIALTHCGLGPSHARRRIAGESYTPTTDDLQYRGDLAIARGAKVDLVLGGHMHTGLEGGWRDPASGTWIFQSYERLEAAHRIVLTIEDTASGPVLKTVKGTLVNLWVDQLGTDQAMNTLLREYSQDIDREMNSVIGHTARGLDRKGLDSQLGNWLTDIMRQRVKADVGLQNTYGIRADLSAGNIRMRDLYEVMPFDNTLVTTSLTGKQLEQVIRKNLHHGKSNIQVSGIRITYRSSSGTSIKDLKITVAGEPLVPARKYSIATNNYLTSGGSGGGILSTVPAHDTGMALRQLFIDDVKRRKQVEAPPTGRIFELP